MARPRVAVGFLLLWLSAHDCMRGMGASCLICRYVPSGGILAINWTRLLYVVQDNFWSAPVGLLMKET